MPIRLTSILGIVIAALSFLYAVAVGILAGVVALFIAAKALQLLNRIGGVPAEAQVLITILLPFIAYLGAEHFGASGILAAVTAGLLTGSTGIFRFLGVSAQSSPCQYDLSVFSGFGFRASAFALSPTGGNAGYDRSP